MPRLCPGVGRCFCVTEAAREESWATFPPGSCPCRESLERADALERLRVAGKLRDRPPAPSTGAVPVPLPSAATPSTEP
jgi:hypothetical protein